MSLKHIDSWDASKATRPLGTGLAEFRDRAHVHHALSRRGFMKGAAGIGMAGAVGATLGGLLQPRGAAAGAPGPGVPNPIPGGLDVGGTIFHVKLPGLLHALDDEPSTITDFTGAVAYTVIDGMGTRTNLATGATEHLPFEVDMRFMKGVFVGTDGRVHRGAWGLL